MSRFSPAAVAASLALLASHALAETSQSNPQEADTGGLQIELNAADPVEGGCKLTFMVTNGMAVALDKAVFETVLFDRAGTVDRLTLFDFGRLPQSRMRVRQFVISDMQCDALGRVLFNGAHECAASGAGEGEGALDAQACETALRPGSRLDIEVLG